MNKSIDKKNLILNLLYFVMVFSLLYIVGIVIRLDLSFLRQLLLAFIVTMSVRLIIKNTVVLYLSLIIFFIGGLTINSYVTPIYPHIEKFTVLFTNIYDHIFLNEIIEAENILPFWTLMIIIYSIFTSAVIFRPKQESFALLIIYLPLYIYYWYLYIDQAYFSLSVFLFAYFLLRGLMSYKKEESKSEPGLRKYFPRISSYWARTTLVYGLLIVLIALMLPKSHNNIRWIWMEEQVSSIMPRIDEMRSSNTNARSSGQAGIFNFSTSGFQENPSKLGGPVSPNNDTVMYVHSDGPVYLRGAVRHFYDGSMWNSALDSSNESKPHLLETNFSSIDYYDRQEYYHEKDVIVQFVDYSSTTLFAPYMPIVVNADRGEQISLTKDHIIELNEGIYDGESYGVKVLESKSYYDLINSEAQYGHDYIENLEEHYLQVPSHAITQRTIDLKDEILSGIDPGRHSDYEKALAIESYLRENYVYTLDAPHVPEGYEFIDFFLFEDKAGYCTYYATTMAIFLRLEGIPSRYVEGYIAHEPMDDGIYEVRQSHAHAWVEAYIEPVGWMTFEPTSAYPLDDRAPEIVDEIEDDDSPENDLASDENTQAQEDHIADSNMAMDSHADIANEEEENPLTSRNIILIVMGIILVILPVRFLIKIIRYHMNERRILKLSKDKKMLVIYDRILENIEKLGHPRQGGETHYEYANRIGYKYEGLKELTKIFVKNKYGDMIPNDKEIEKFVSYRKELEDQLKNHYGKIKYYIKKY